MALSFATIRFVAVIRQMVKGPTTPEMPTIMGEPREYEGFWFSLTHDLRRTCARLCHLAGGELDQIQFLLGHVSIQTTNIISGVSRSSDSLSTRSESNHDRQGRNTRPFPASRG